MGTRQADTWAGGRRAEALLQGTRANDGVIIFPGPRKRAGGREGTSSGAVTTLPGRQPGPVDIPTPPTWTCPASSPRFSRRFCCRCSGQCSCELDFAVHPIGRRARRRHVASWCGLLASRGRMDWERWHGQVDGRRGDARAKRWSNKDAGARWTSAMICHVGMVRRMTRPCRGP
jgi:hypothetical protein